MMNKQLWLQSIRSIARDAERASRTIVLTSENAQSDLLNAETTLKTLSQELSLASRVILERWNMKGSRVLLDTVPELLNPGASSNELNPSGASMRVTFPSLCNILDQTEELAVIVDGANEGSVLITGAVQQTLPQGQRWPFSPDGRRYWAYFLPQSATKLASCQSRLGYPLSPQMRQLYLRAWGTADDALCPYVYRPELLVKGALYSDVYRDIADQVPLTQDTIHRLREFVCIYDTVVGNSIGFFADETQPNSEPAIMYWDHETAEFQPWAVDFATAVSRLIADF
jgi:hypothetical protein